MKKKEISLQAVGIIFSEMFTYINFKNKNQMKYCFVLYCIVHVLYTAYHPLCF
jgi:hypothetical protein